MAHEWIECKLADACSSIDYGLTASATDIEMGPRFLRITDIVSGHIDWNTVPHVAVDEATIVKYRLHDGDIVLARTGASTGASSYIKHPPPAAVFASYLVRLQTKPQFDARYLSYYLKSDTFWTFIRSVLGDKSAQPNASASTMTQAPLRAPIDVDEQRAIANILGTLDDKIELNWRMNETLEAIARELFQSWFVDFDPVRVKLDGRHPSGLDKATAALFPSSVQNSPLGPIPQGWRVGSIYEIADVIYGAPFSSKLFNSNRIGRPLIRIRDLVDENPDIWTPEIHPKGYTVRAGDIVVGMDGEFRAYLWGGGEAWINQRVCIFVPKPGFSAAFVRNSIFAPLAQVEATETATTVIHIGKNDIDRFTVVIPDASVMEAFERLCQPWYDQIVFNKQQSRTLITLRDTLLPKVLSGELSVRSLENDISQ